MMLAVAAGCCDSSTSDSKWLLQRS
jgi:hypothetical protein